MLTRVVAFRRTEFNICLVLHGLTQIVQIVLTVLKESLSELEARKSQGYCGTLAEASTAL